MARPGIAASIVSLVRGNPCGGLSKTSPCHGDMFRASSAPPWGCLEGICGTDSAAELHF